MSTSFLVSADCKVCGGTFDVNRLIFGHCEDCFIKRDDDSLSEKEVYYKKGYDDGYGTGYDNGYEYVIGN